MMLPKEAKERKDVPLFSGLIRYFPRALIAVAELSRIGNEQHNPGSPIHWDRSKSGDELDALTRHLFDAGQMDTDRVWHDTKVAWRALANLEKLLEGLEQPQLTGIHMQGMQQAVLDQYDPQRTWGPVNIQEKK